jgi:hypothetical protein
MEMSARLEHTVCVKARAGLFHYYDLSCKPNTVCMSVEFLMSIVS